MCYLLYYYIIYYHLDMHFAYATSKVYLVFYHSYRYCKKLMILSINQLAIIFSVTVICILINKIIQYTWQRSQTDDLVLLYANIKYSIFVFIDCKNI